MAQDGFVTIPAMRENGSKTVLRGSIRARGAPQRQHAVEAELIDCTHNTRLLDLPRDRAKPERIKGDGSRRGPESQVADPRDELEVAHRQVALVLLLGAQPRDRGFFVAELIDQLQLDR